jgi:hypothetical protein
LHKKVEWSTNCHALGNISRFFLVCPEFQSAVSLERVPRTQSSFISLFKPTTAIKLGKECLRQQRREQKLHRGSAISNPLHPLPSHELLIPNLLFFFFQRLGVQHSEVCYFLQAVIFQKSGPKYDGISDCNKVSGKILQLCSLPRLAWSSNSSFLGACLYFQSKEPSLNVATTQREGVCIVGCQSYPQAVRVCKWASQTNGIYSEYGISMQAISNIQSWC